MQQEEKKLSLDEIHAELLEQLRDITAVCKKHNISYNMMCGSLLGAVRHKGFIPWDDDAETVLLPSEVEPGVHGKEVTHLLFALLLAFTERTLNV